MGMNRRLFFRLFGAAAAAPSVIAKSEDIPRPAPEKVRAPDTPMMIYSTAESPGLYWTTSEIDERSKP